MAPELFEPEWNERALLKMLSVLFLKSNFITGLTPLMVMLL